MIQTEEKIRWNIKDLDILSHSDSINYEIIEGELFVTRTPHRRHQQICVKIARELDIWNESTGLGETIITPGIIFSDEDNVIPDVVWVSRERLAQIEDEAGHLTSAPELIVEVISPGIENEKRDREVKVKLYSRQGVQEYWIVDRFKKQVEIYRRQQARLILDKTLFSHDEITSPLLPSFTCLIERFFPQ